MNRRTRLTRASPLRIAAAISALLHLLALLVADQLLIEQQHEVFRARFSMPTRFSPRRAQSSRPTLPQTQMEYRASRVGGRIAAPGLPGIATSAPVVIGDLPLQLSGEISAPKAGGPALTQEDMPSATQSMPSDTMASQSLELVRIEDMMRADDKRAVVIPDPDSIRATKGFIKFTSLHLDGAWSLLMPADEAAVQGRPVLGDLARYMRDYTGIHAQIRSTSVRNFMSNQLLLDPIHFLFRGPQRLPGSEPRVRLAIEEIDLLSTYLRGGGFLFVDAGGEADDRRFLRSIVDLLRLTLGSEGRLAELPARHPLYHAFYDYENGFPGECKEPVDDTQIGSGWFYPDRLPGEFCPRGIWGIELGGQLVGVISDLNLHSNWSDLQDTASADSATTQSQTLPFLRAGTNIVLHALLRSESLATKHSQPAWQRQQRRSATQTAMAGTTMTDSGEIATEETHLALIRAPIGSSLGNEPLKVAAARAAPIEMVEPRAKGLLLHGLPPGMHELRVDYGGKVGRTTIELVAGRVTTVSFRPRALGLWGGLNLDQMGQRLDPTSWEQRFNDLYLLETTVDLP